MASDINPIAHLTCTQVIALGDYMELPHHLVHKIPADGLTGKSDEDNFGFPYEVLDAILTTGLSPFEIDQSMLNKIGEMHRKSLHKFQPYTLNHLWTD